jgi:hypothetical protein
MKIHPDVYKLNDPRIDSLLKGQLSMESFARTIQPNDPLVLIKDTIYALSENEFYSTRSVRRITDEYEQAFHYILSMEDLSCFTDEERKLIDRVKHELPTCPVCKYKRYRQALHRLAKHYKLPIPTSETTIIEPIKYPTTKAPIEPTVTTLLEHLYEVPHPDRKPCIDCVEKHVAQAYILAQESEMGYPEHRILMCGHLAEAIDESPNDIPELKYTLQTCLAETMKTDKAFLPLYPVLALIKLIRQHINQDPVDDDARHEAPPVTDTIDLVPEIQQEIVSLPQELCKQVYSKAVDIRNSILEYKVSKKEEPRIRFEGLVANLAEMVVNAAPLFANMLRNRRLLFVADPALAVDAGYDFEDIVQLAQLGV